MNREELINLIESFHLGEDWNYPENFEYNPFKGPAILWLIHDDQEVSLEYGNLPEDLEDYIIYQENGLTILED